MYCVVRYAEISADDSYSQPETESKTYVSVVSVNWVDRTEDKVWWPYAGCHEFTKPDKQSWTAYHLIKVHLDNCTKKDGVKFLKTEVPDLHLLSFTESPTAASQPTDVLTSPVLTSTAKRTKLVVVSPKLDVSKMKLLKEKHMVGRKLPFGSPPSVSILDQMAYCMAYVRIIYFPFERI